MAGTAEELAKIIEENIREQVSKNRGETLKPAEPEDVAIEVIKRTAGKGQIMFSELFGVKVAEEKDFPVTVYDAKDWSPVIRAFVPAEDKHYEVQVEEAMKILSAWEENEKVLVTGPTGSGKSTLIRHCAAKTRRPFIRCNMNGDIESSALFGCIVVEDGATIWKDGAATEAALYGAVLLIDEWEIMPPEIGMGFQCLLEDDGFLFLKEKPGSSEERMIIPHERFRIVYAGNTVGQGDETGSFAGANVQNTATIDRFQTTVVLDYLDKGHETKVIKARCGALKPDIIKKMLQYAELVRTSNRQGTMVLTMSPRTLINWGRKIQRYGNIKEALVFAFMNKLNTNDKKLCLDFYTKVFGK